MSKALQHLEALYEAKKKPTYDELEAALLESLAERNAFEGMVKDMSGWLSRLVHAHYRKDSKALVTTLNDFIQERVVIRDETKGALH
ncbi:hypothetical protein ACO0LO_01920 [Undibacterium sp. TJN25]|uniref:hypothetical protein n=1 Tax=Undibacterium sp. TJN25 TaxID=3413056 RepID=UPI003BF39C86